MPGQSALEEEKYRGPDQILAMWREVLRDLPDLRIELEEVVRDQGDVLVVAVSFQGMGRASGADIRATVFQAISFRDGQVTRIQGFQDRDEALEAVGLRE
jgi:ketosteroid isomerase-like protein